MAPTHCGPHHWLKILLAPSEQAAALRSVSILPTSLVEFPVPNQHSTLISRPSPQGPHPHTHFLPLGSAQGFLLMGAQPKGPASPPLRKEEGDAPKPTAPSTPTHHRLAPPQFASQ